jgi:hypothetical protein
MLYSLLVEFSSEVRHQYSLGHFELGVGGQQFIGPNPWHEKQDMSLRSNPCLMLHTHNIEAGTSSYVEHHVSRPLRRYNHITTEDYYKDNIRVLLDQELGKTKRRVAVASTASQEYHKSEYQQGQILEEGPNSGLRTQGIAPLRTVLKLKKEIPVH